MSGDDSLLTLRAGVATRLRLLFTEQAVPTVRVHRGAFGAAEIERYSNRAPAVVVACTGSAGSKRAGGSLRVPCRFAAFVLAKDHLADRRDDVAMSIVGRLLRFVPFETNFCSPVDAQSPTDIEASNMHDGRLDDLGVTLWVVKWSQVVVFDGLSFDCNGELPAPVDFTTLYAQYDVGNGMENDQQIDIPQV